MITAPSMMMPKSIAPRLIRLALTLFLEHPSDREQHREWDYEGSCDRGLKVSENKDRITMTSNAPSTRFFSTVAIVASTPDVSGHRSRGPRHRPEGSYRFDPAWRQRAAQRIVPGLADQEHRGTQYDLISVERGPHQSVDLCLPSRRRHLETRTGTPLRDPITICLISSMFAT